jgi:hypothetical protein
MSRAREMRALSLGSNPSPSMWASTSRTTSKNGRKGQLAAPSKRAPIQLKKLFGGFGMVTAEVIISAPEIWESEDEVDESDDNVVRAFWRKMIARYDGRMPITRASWSSSKAQGTRHYHCRGQVAYWFRCTPKYGSIRHGPRGQCACSTTGSAVALRDWLCRRASHCLELACAGQYCRRAICGETKGLTAINLCESGGSRHVRNKIRSSGERFAIEWRFQLTKLSFYRLVLQAAALKLLKRTMKKCGPSQRRH